MPAELRFRAMGTDVHLVIVGGDGPALHRARRQIEVLEQRWSRFLPDSEVSRLNRAGGAPTVVHPDTFAVIARAVEAWTATAGRFDPTVLADLVAAGYDHSYEVCGSSLPPGEPREPADRQGCAGITLVPEIHAVALPPGTGLDLGGIGKGYAADLVVGELLGAGAAGACANLGGDLRVAGTAPGHDGWVVGVDDPFEPGHELARLALGEGAVATSSRTRRTLPGGGHHLVDPRTGRPARSGLAQVTVVAGDATEAEVVAKAAFLAGPREGVELVAAWGTAGLLVDDEGTILRAGDIEGYLR